MNRDKETPKMTEVAQREAFLAMPMEVFRARFKERMLAKAGDEIGDYAYITAPIYWEDPEEREQGPEDCADADRDHWCY